MSTSVNNIKISAKISPGVDLYTIESNLSKEEIVEKYQSFLVIKKEWSIVVFKQGNKSYNHVNICGLKNYCEILESIDVLARISNTPSANIGFTIDNICGNGDLKTHIDLEKFQSFACQHPIQYNPEIFPGMYIRCDNLVMILFSNGKVNFVGAKRFEDLDESFHRLKQLVTSYQNHQNALSTF